VDEVLRTVLDREIGDGLGKEDALHDSASTRSAAIAANALSNSEEKRAPVLDINTAVVDKSECA
jgi:hypothetical protein